MMWYEIPTWPGYRASLRGEILSVKGDEPRILKWECSGHYARVVLRRDGKSVTQYVHRLIALTFLGECPEGLQVCHGPGGNFDNRVSNLRYDTPSNNILDQVANGTHFEAARTKCDKGHDFTPDNIYWRSGRNGKTYRKCKRCQLDATKRWRQKKSAASRNSSVGASGSSPG